VLVIFTIVAFLKYWAGLYKKDDKEAILARAEQLLQATRDLGRSDDVGASLPRSGVLMITG
jgi:hypothetical protein